MCAAYLLPKYSNGLGLMVSRAWFNADWAGAVKGEVLSPAYKTEMQPTRAND